MIFKTEINPRSFDGYYGMIAHLQERCIKEVGAWFDTTKIVMGQISHNSEICWFEGFVDDANIQKIANAPGILVSAEKYIAGKTYSGKTTIEAADALECLRLDRLGVFSDSHKLTKEVNINIASLGDFHITQNNGEHLAQLKCKIVELLTRAVNDASTIS